MNNTQGIFPKKPYRLEKRVFFSIESDCTNKDSRRYRKVKKNSKKRRRGDVTCAVEKRGIELKRKLLCGLGVTVSWSSIDLILFSIDPACSSRARPLEWISFSFLSSLFTFLYSQSRVSR